MIPATTIGTVMDLPRTRSGKPVELAVRDVVPGQPVKAIEARRTRTNPEVQEMLRDLEGLRS
jgi:hypothetical protein